MEELLDPNQKALPVTLSSTPHGEVIDKEFAALYSKEPVVEAGDAAIEYRDQQWTNFTKNCSGKTMEYSKKEEEDIYDWTKVTGETGKEVKTLPWKKFAESSGGASMAQSKMERTTNPEFRPTRNNKPVIIVSAASKDELASKLKE